MARENHTVKSLKEIGEVAKGLGSIKVGDLHIPQLKLEKIPSAAMLQQAEDIDKKNDENEKQIREYVVELAEALASPKAMKVFSQNVFNTVRQLTQFIKDYPIEIENARMNLTNAFIGGATEKFPPTDTALNLIADSGLALGFFQAAGEKTSDEQAVILPVTIENEDGERKKRLRLTTHFPESRGIMGNLRKKVLEATAIRRDESNRKREELRAGAKSFLEVLKTGGEAVFFAPTVTDGEGVRLGGYVKVRVEHGIIAPVDAVGPCAKKISEFAEMEIEIPLSTMGKEKFRLEKFELNRGRANAMVIFHSICFRGKQNEEANALRTARIKAMKESTTLSLRDFFTEPYPAGTVFVYFPDWVFGEKKYHVNFQIERRGDGHVRVLDTDVEEFFKEVRDFTALQQLPKSSPLDKMLRKLEWKFSSHAPAAS